MCIAFIVSLTLSSAACSFSNEGSLPSELRAAIDSMESADAYEFTATMENSSGVVRIDGTFAAPNTVAQTIRVPDRPPVEMRLSGTQISLKDPVSGSFTSSESVQSSNFDLRSAFTALRSAGSISSTGDTYTFTLDPDSTVSLAGSDASGSAEVTATTGAAGLSMLSYRVTVAGRPMTVRIEYRQV